MIERPDFNRMTDKDGSIRPIEDTGYRFTRKPTLNIPVAPAPPRRDDGA